MRNNMKRIVKIKNTENKGYRDDVVNPRDYLW